MLDHAMERSRRTSDRRRTALGALAPEKFRALTEELVKSVSSRSLIGERTNSCRRTRVASRMIGLVNAGASTGDDEP